MLREFDKKKKEASERRERMKIYMRQPINKSNKGNTTLITCKAAKHTINSGEIGTHRTGNALSQLSYWVKSCIQINARHITGDSRCMNPYAMGRLMGSPHRLNWTLGARGKLAHR